MNTYKITFTDCGDDLIMTWQAKTVADAIQQIKETTCFATEMITKIEKVQE